MDAPTIMVTGRLGLCFAFVIGGIVAIFLGYFLFRAGIGLVKENGKLEIKLPTGGVKMATSSVGGTLMLTAAVWGALAYMSTPQLKMSGGFIDVSDALIKTLPQTGHATLSIAQEKEIADFASVAKRKIEADPSRGHRVWNG